MTPLLNNTLPEELSMFSSVTTAIKNPEYIFLKIWKESNKTICVQVQRTSFSNQTKTYITRFIQQSTPKRHSEHPQNKE